MRVLVWLFRAFLFFALFAFALNNQHEAIVRWFFGHEWRAPLVIVVLVAFAAGSAFGVLAMVPAWWRHRRVAQRKADAAAASAGGPPSVPPVATAGPNAAVVADTPAMPPREGL